MKLAALVLVSACAEAQVPATTVADSGTSLFAAFGSIGVRPDPLPPDYDVEYAVMVVDVDNAGAAVTGASVSALEVGGAKLRKLDGVVVVLPPSIALPPLASAGSWAVYTQTAGPAFAGSLPHGHTRLRIRAWLDHAPTAPTAMTVTIGAGPRAWTISGSISGSFPS